MQEATALPKASTNLLAPKKPKMGSKSWKPGAWLPDLGHGCRPYVEAAIGEDKTRFLTDWSPLHQLRDGGNPLCDIGTA